MNKQELINNLLAIWDPIAVRRFGRGFTFDEYKGYVKELLEVKNEELKNYLIKIFQDMVNDPDEYDLISIDTIANLIILIKNQNE